MTSKLKAISSAPDAVPYPAAPRGLSRRQRTLWRDITRAKPPDWWDAATLPLLAALVAHVETLEAVQGQIGALGELSDPRALARLEQLARLRDREAKALASLSTKLRLTPQSRYEPRAAFRDGRLRAADSGNPFTSFKTREDGSMTQHNPMDRLPELPSELPADAAGFWAGTVLMQAATERQWPGEQLRMQLFVMLAGLAGAASDETLHAELQAALEVSRAHGADKQ